MLRQLLSLSILCTVCTASMSAEIQGVVRDDQGFGLKGVRVCLSALNAAPGDCRKKNFTNNNGEYKFKGLGAGERYTVRVLADASLRARKTELYASYVWAPLAHAATLTSKSTVITDLDFVGSFNFSNFQPEIQLAASDFPELRNYDFANDEVFLKLYTIDGKKSEQNLLYLGQVLDPSKLFIEISVPVAETKLFYEIYSATKPQPIFGSISLTG